MPGKRRSNGEGSIRKLPSGLWYCQYMDGYKPNGKRNLRHLSAPTRSELLVKLREAQNNKEDEPAPSPVAFDAWVQQWLDAYREQVQPSTYCNYRYTAALLTRYFTDRPLQDIKAMEINSFMHWLVQQGYSGSQLSKCRAMLIQIYDAAEANDLVTKNYARKSFHGARMQNNPTPKTKDAFTEEEVRLLMTHLPDDLLGNSIRFLLVTGLRVQELLALQPRDIAQDGSLVHVSKAVKTVDGLPQLGPPKSVRSRRSVPVPPAYRPLALWLHANGGRAFLWTSSRDDLLVSVSTFRHKYYKAVEKVPGVRRLSPHSCRHTYVSALERCHVPMEMIARLTGHSDIRTTDRYLHIDDRTLQDAVAMLDPQETEKEKPL